MSIDAYSKKINKYITDRTSKITTRPSKGLLAPKQIKKREQPEDAIEKIAELVASIRDKRMQLKEKGASRG